MGIDVQLYRSRIGTFHGGRSQKSHSCINYVCVRHIENRRKFVYKIPQPWKIFSETQQAVHTFRLFYACFIDPVTNFATHLTILICVCKYWKERCSRTVDCDFKNESDAKNTAFEVKCPETVDSDFKNQSDVRNTDCVVITKTVHDTVCCTPEVQVNNVICDIDECRYDLDLWFDSNFGNKYLNFKFCKYHYAGDNMVPIENCIGIGSEVINGSHDDDSDSDRIDETESPVTINCTKSDTGSESSDNSIVAECETHDITECTETYLKSDINVNNGSCDMREESELSISTFPNSEADEISEHPASSLTSSLKASHELPTGESESEISFDNKASYSRSVTIIGSDDSDDTPQFSVPFLNDQATKKNADRTEKINETSVCDTKMNPKCSVVTESDFSLQLHVDQTSYESDPGATRNEVSTCDKKPLQCSVVTKSQLTPTASKTEEEDEDRRSVKDSIRRYTTPLEPMPQEPETFTVAPAFEPNQKEDAKELEVRRDSATSTNRTRNSDVVRDSAAGARARSPQNSTLSNISAPASQYHSDQSIALDGGPSSVHSDVLISSPSSLSQNMTVSEKSASSSLPVNACRGIGVQQGSDGLQPDTDGHSLSSATVVEQSSSEPNGASGFESNGHQTSIEETKEALDGQVQQTNIAQPTSDQPTETAQSTQSETPRFEPLSSVLHKLSIGEDLPPQETMRYEMLRLYTLHSFPRENKPYIIRLAQAGFYYANNGDEVVCYCCGKRRNYWEETDNPMAVHQRLNPRCSFLLRNDEVNVKIHAASTNGHVSVENASCSRVTSLTGSNNIVSSSGPNSDNAEITRPNSDNAEIARTSSDNAEIAQPNSDNAEIARSSSDNAEIARPCSDNAEIARPNSDHAEIAQTSSDNAEIARPSSDNAEIGSSNSATTTSQPCSSGNGAESTTPSTTRVQRDASRSHGGFVMQTQETRHSSAEGTQQKTTNPAPTASSPGATANRTTNMNQKAKKVKFPKYVEASKRTATFEDCDLILPVSSLVEAGLFFTGYGDCCRCHSCGIGLRHWGEEDDPWVEHARWSKDCEFLKEKKGQEFIDLVHMALRVSQNDNESPSNGDVNSASANQTPSEIDRLLHGSAAQSLLEMGYSTDIIRQALRAVLDHQGRSAITAVTLTEKVFEIENQSSESSAASSNTEGAEVKSEGAISGATSGATSGASAGAASTAHKKSQLQEQKRLARENAILKEQSICSICKKNSVCIVFLPCGHLITCETCAPFVKYCNLSECGKYIKGTVRTYFS